MYSIGYGLGMGIGIGIVKIVGIGIDIDIDIGTVKDTTLLFKRNVGTAFAIFSHTLITFDHPSFRSSYGLPLKVGDMKWFSSVFLLITLAAASASPSGGVNKTVHQVTCFPFTSDRDNRPLNASCRCNKECNSDRCHRGKCVCKSDSDCSGAEVCVKDFLRSNHCQVPWLPIDAVCNEDSLCASNHCSWRRCTCKYDKDCTGNRRCKERRIRRNTCK